MNGAVELYEAAKKQGIKPIIGLELYVVTDRHSRAGARRRNAHLTLLARNEVGFKNLPNSDDRLPRGLHGKPRVDWELLRQHHEGVIALTGCLAARRHAAPRRRRQAALEEVGGSSRYSAARTSTSRSRRTGCPSNASAPKLARSPTVGLPIVATNDVHYLRREDAAAHDALLCVQTEQRATRRMRFATDQFYLKPTDEMRERFRIPGAIDSTVEIAERATSRSSSATQAAHVPSTRRLTEDSYLRDLARGLARATAASPAPRRASASRSSSRSSTRWASTATS